MHWVLLSIGIAIEILATTALKLSDGFTKLGFAGLTPIRHGIRLLSLINCGRRPMLVFTRISQTAEVGSTGGGPDRAGPLLKIE